MNTMTPMKPSTNWKRVVVPEHADDRGQHDANQAHEQELAPAREAAARGRAVDARARRTCRRETMKVEATDSPV